MAKVFFKFLVLGAVFLSLLSSCSGRSSAGGRTTVEFWGHVNEAWNNSHRNIISRFNASQPEIRVVGTFFPYSEFEAKIQTSFLAGGESADIYEIWGGWGLDFVATGVLSEVPSGLINDLVADSYEPVLGAFQSGGKYYGLPVEFNNEYGGMLVNKPRFEQMGIPYPQTWDEIIDVARRTTVRRGDIFDMRGLDFTEGDTLTHTFLSMILSQGGEYWVNNRFSFATPEARTALQTLVDYVAVDRLTNLDSALGMEGIDSWHFMGRDEAMMVPRGPWVISELAENYGKEIGVDVDFVSFPFFDRIRVFTAETGWSIAVPGTSKVQDEAWTYVSFFLQPENLMQHNINSAQIPPRRSVAQNPEYVRQLPFMAPVLDILQYSVFIGPFNTEVLKQNLVQVFVSLAARDGAYASVDAALTSLENSMNSQLRL